MTRKEQNKILDAKIESNVNQCKIDRLNAEISAFSSGDLNKYELDLNYKPIALDKARFEFSPLGKTFSAGLDKTAQGYQEEGIMKLLRGGARQPRPDNNNDNNNDDDNDDDDDRPDYNNMLDLETEEEASERISKNALDKFKNNIEIKMNNLDKMVKSKEDEWKTKLNKLNNDTKKIGNYIKKNNNIKKELDIVEKERDNLLLKVNQSNEEKNIVRNELKSIEDKLNKKINDIDKEKLINELIEVKKNINIKNKHITKLKDEKTNKLNIKKLNTEIEEIQDELENVNRSIKNLKQENNELNILNDRLIKEKQKKKKK